MNVSARNGDDFVMHAVGRLDRDVNAISMEIPAGPRRFGERRLFKDLRERARILIARRTQGLKDCGWICLIIGFVCVM